MNKIISNLAFIKNLTVRTQNYIYVNILTVNNAKITCNFHILTYIIISNLNVTKSLTIRKQNKIFL